MIKRLKRKRKNEVKFMEKISLKSQEVRACEAEGEERFRQTDQVLPESLDSLVKQESIMDFSEQDEKFQDCEDKEYKCDCGKVRFVCVFIVKLLETSCQYNCKASEYTHGI